MKQHTIIVVPHARAKFRKWRLTTLQASLLLTTLAVLTVGGIVTTILYFNTNFDRQELDEMHRRNADLRARNQSFQATIRDLQGRMADYQERIRKLAIVAGVSEIAPSGGAGIGGVGESGMMGGAVSALEHRAETLGDVLSQLQEEFADQQRLISSTPAISPVKGILTSRFGYRTDPFTKRRTFHNGIDIVAPRGKKVIAPGDGLVTKAGRVQGLGNAVYVSHGFGLTSRYGHLLRIHVKPGQRVHRGDVIGLVGNSGRSSGYHLHYEVRDHGRPVNPLGYILDSTRP